ncbi:MAG: hypothetical protein RLZZ618_2470 [Pseudomonadota bacterium]|jgi:tRNA pseudouridine32 synthase/23S rRNA pseudouridine746 synthase
MRPSASVSGRAERAVKQQRNSPTLPLKNGVSASRVALPMGPWPTVLAFLCERFPQVPAGEWRGRLTNGSVLDEQGRPVDVHAPYTPHRTLSYYRSLPPEPVIPFEAEVLFQDEHLVVVDKPHFLPVTPGGRYLQQTLLVRLKQSMGLDTLSPLHRLDRETAGLVLFSVRPAERDAYHAMFRDRAVFKRYEAVAPSNEAMSWPQVRRSRLAESATFMQAEEVAGEPNAETHIDCVEVRGTLARYLLTPLTGQRHQLRVHMAALGLPLLNDMIYPDLQPALAEGVPPDYARPLQLLAKSLSFTDPVTGALRVFDSRRELSWAWEPGRKKEGPR